MVNFHENVYHRRGEEGRSHIPPMFFWVAIIRGIQLFLAFIVLVLTAYSASVFGSAYFSGYGMSWFTFVWTVLFLGYVVVSGLMFPQFYLSWAQLGLEVVTTVFWLTTFALLAQEVTAWNEVGNLFGEADAFGFDYFPKWHSAINATKGATAMAAINWLLFVVTLVTFGLALHKHRMANGGTGFNGFAQRTTPADVEAGEKLGPNGQQPVELREV